ncbi:MAG: hypothetical protein WCY19_07845 [Candidatus Gastranaerophilaceae bacterium]
MFGIIKGTNTTKGMMRNITRSLQRKSPSTPYVNYTIYLENLKNNSCNSTFSITERNGKLMTVGDLCINYIKLFRLKTIQASINHKTGNMCVSKKPFLISNRGIKKRVTEFLAQIQPKNIAKAPKVYLPRESLGADGCILELKRDFKDFSVETTITCR